MVLAMGHLSACDTRPDRGEIAFAGLSLSQAYSQELRGLQDRLRPLSSRVAQLPKELAGSEELRGLVKDQQARLRALADRLDTYPDQLRSAASSGGQARVDALTGALRKQIGASLQTERRQLADAQARLTSLNELQKRIAAAEAAAAAAAERLAFEKTLTSGFKLQGNDNGIEKQLLAFVEDPTRAPDKVTWFDFDRLTFQTGSANLDMSRSQSQLTNIAEIMKAFPRLRLKLGGYTDNTGSKRKNQELSAKRADNVKKQLVALGVQENRLRTEGYGPEHPACPANDTPECRAQNRRIAIRVDAK